MSLALAVELLKEKLRARRVRATTLKNLRFHTVNPRYIASLCRLFFGELIAVRQLHAVNCTGGLNEVQTGWLFMEKRYKTIG